APRWVPCGVICEGVFRCTFSAVRRWARLRRMRSRSSRIAGASVVPAVLAALAGCGTAAPELSGVEFEAPPTAVLYEVRLEGMPSEEMATLAEEALSVYRNRDRGATSMALLQRRAENDIGTIRQILRSYGYYD